jgi:hypothetical protein
MKTFLPNLVYLLLALPLGILYFVILITGYTLGAGLIITLVGVPILVTMIFVTYLLGDLDRAMTSKLLGVRIAKPQAKPARDDSARSILVAQLKSPQFWKEFGYLLLKMPLGIVAFVVTITFVSVSLVLIAAPFIVTYVPDAQMTLWYGLQIDTLEEALVTSVVGLGLGAMTVLIINGFARVLGFISVWALGTGE